MDPLGDKFMLEGDSDSGGGRGYTAKEKQPRSALGEGFWPGDVL